MNRSAWITSRVGKVLGLLAADPAIQVASFPSGVHAPDEIALELDYTLERLDGDAEKALPSSVIGELRSINQTFDEMSGQDFEERWTVRALENDASWISIRSRARVLAEEFGIRYESPISFADTEYIQ